MRVRKDLTISAGVRQEFQTHIGGLHLAPRGRHRVVAVQERQDDGSRRRRRVLRLARRADVPAGRTARRHASADRNDHAARLSRRHAWRTARSCFLHGRVQFAPDLEQPQLSEAIAGVEQTLPGDVRLNAMYVRRRGVEPAARRQCERAARERRAAGSGLGHGHRDSVGRALAAGRDQRQPQLRAAAAAVVPGRELHLRPVDRRSRRPVQPGRRTTTISRPSAGPPSATHGTGS